MIVLCQNIHSFTLRYSLGEKSVPLMSTSLARHNCKVYQGHTARASLKPRGDVLNSSSQSHVSVTLQMAKTALAVSYKLR